MYIYHIYTHISDGFVVKPISRTMSTFETFIHSLHLKAQCTTQAAPVTEDAPAPPAESSSDERGCMFFHSETHTWSAPGSKKLN